MKPNKKMVCIRLPLWLIEWLREQPQSQAVLIEDALVAAHGIEPPQDK